MILPHFMYELEITGPLVPVPAIPPPEPDAPTIPLAFTDPVWLTHVGVSSIGAGLYRIKETLKAAGWTVTKSSDGTANYATDGTDVITSGASGANGFNNVAAHIALRDPDGVRGLHLRTVGTGTGTSASDAAALIEQSPTAAFTGGDLTTSPTASGSREVWGSMLFRLNGGTCELWGGADQEAPFGFYFAALGPVSNWSPVMGLAMLPVISVQPDDDDPVAWYAMGGTGGTVWTAALGGDGAITTDPARALLPDGSDWRGFSNISDALGYIVTSDAGGFVPAQHMLLVSAADDYAKGWTRNLAVHPDSETVSDALKRVYDDENGNANVYIRAFNCFLPWNGTVPSGWSNNGVARVLTRGIESAG